jgi:CRISPR-associated endonuclease Csn1
MSNSAMPTPSPLGTVWAFDLGLASLGEAVRRDSEFLHAASHLIPAELAQRGPATTAGTPASLYRAMKTREAHRAREERLRAICLDAGIEVLAAKRVARTADKKGWQVVQQADPRLTREFPPRTGPDKDTCFTSCLLRIKLLQGSKLEPWQVFKALHSAIQRRGYDPDLAWKGKRSERAEAQDEEKVTQQRLDAYQNTLELMAPGHPEFHYPCYLDAWRMGLWAADQPAQTLLRIDHTAAAARNRELASAPAVVAPRERVIAECRALLESAAKQFPKLAGRVDEILFGKGGVPYASYDPALRKKHGLRQGGANDWDGILGQKVPRFDNRIVAKCALIPRLSVCSAEPRKFNGEFVADSLLPAEVTLLMKLKNLKVDRGGGTEGKLQPAEIRALFEDRRANQPSGWAFKPSVLAKALKNHANGARPAAGHSEVAAPSLQGRSRFSRPALRILRDLILSGRSPMEQHAHELAWQNGNTNPQRGLIPTDLDFLKRMSPRWEDIHVPDQQHETLLATREQQGREAAIRRLLGSINDPIVRHRLETFWRRLRYLETEAKFGEPSQVVLEFVRKDFMGEKAIAKLTKITNERERARKAARENAGKLGAQARSAATKLELLEAQGGICLYTGEGLAPSSVESLEIEHIVPRNHPTAHGPDAMVNYVVTTKATNDAKGNQTPHEWFASRNWAGWDAYKARVEGRATQLGRKKLLLLTSQDAPSLVERYTALAETAWIAKLAQTLVALHFGWPIRSEKGERRITVVSGGLTARIRRRYRLNSLLNPCPPDQDPIDWEETCEKNRSDKRHHALDAMVISFIPGWARDQEKEKFFGLPKEVTRDSFAKALEKVSPHNLFLERSSLEATAYGERTIDERRYAVARAVFTNLAVKTERNGKRLLKAPKDIETHRIIDPVIRRDVEGFLVENPDLDLETWDKWCSAYRRGERGPMVKKLLLTISKPDSLAEYADLSKDNTGQLRRGAKHRGYFIVEVAAPTKMNPAKRALEVRPSYTHQNPHQVGAEIKTESDCRIVGFFESGCTVEIHSAIDHPKTPLKPGRYRLNSIWEQGSVVVTDQASKASAPISLAKFVAAGFHRVD